MLSIFESKDIDTYIDPKLCKNKYMYEEMVKIEEKKKERADVDKIISIRKKRKSKI